VSLRPILPALFLSASLATASTASAAPAAERARPAAVAPIGLAAPTTPSTAPAATDDAARYAARDARAKAQKRYKGGSGYVVIGGTTLGIVLLVVILILVL
jgi:hypothetical protein